MTSVGEARAGHEADPASAEDAERRLLHAAHSTCGAA
jgi:hypothetical protein